MVGFGSPLCHVVRVNACPNRNQQQHGHLRIHRAVGRVGTFKTRRGKNGGYLGQLYYNQSKGKGFIKIRAKFYLKGEWNFSKHQHCAIPSGLRKILVWLLKENHRILEDGRKKASFCSYATPSPTPPNLYLKSGVRPGLRWAYKRVGPYPGASQSTSAQGRGRPFLLVRPP